MLSTTPAPTCINLGPTDADPAGLTETLEDYLILGLKFSSAEGGLCLESPLGTLCGKSIR